MKYVYTGGPYAEFRGYIFWAGKAVTITDKGTLQAIATRHDFKPVDEPFVSEARIHNTDLNSLATWTETKAVQNPCPKCGKALKKQGAHFHIRACKGA